MPKPDVAGSAHSASFHFTMDGRNADFILRVPEGAKLHVTNDKDAVGVEFEYRSRYQLFVRLTRTDLPMDEYAYRMVTGLAKEPGFTFSKIGSPAGLMEARQRDGGVALRGNVVIAT
jgi:hypothetical protein